MCICYCLSTVRAGRAKPIAIRIGAGRSVIVIAALILILFVLPSPNRPLPEPAGSRPRRSKRAASPSTRTPRACRWQNGRVTGTSQGQSTRLGKDSRAVNHLLGGAQEVSWVFLAVLIMAEGQKRSADWQS